MYMCMYIFHIKLTQNGGIGKGQKSSGNWEENEQHWINWKFTLNKWEKAESIPINAFMNGSREKKKVLNYTNFGFATLS